MKKSSDAVALLALRKARRKTFGAPGWADHVLNNVRMFTTAKKLVVTIGRTVEKISK